MASVQPTYLANVDFINERMKDKGLSRNKLVEKAPTTHATLRAILDEGKRAYLATYAKLANPHALDVEEVSLLYIDDDPSHVSGSQPVIPRGAALDVKLEKDATTFDETTVGQIVAAIMKEAGLKSVVIVNIILNSVTLRLSVSEEEIPALLIAFRAGKLDHLKITAITIRSPKRANKPGTIKKKFPDVASFRRSIEELFATEEPADGGSTESIDNADGSLTLRRKLT
jgi:hypothetical protein